MNIVLAVLYTFLAVVVLLYWKVSIEWALELWGISRLESVSVLVMTVLGTAIVVVMIH
jgi:hypothetical protein